MLKKVGDFLKNDKGFTLIELMFVVVIIGILCGVLAPNFVKSKESAEIARIRADIKLLESAAAMYYVDNDEYPDDVEDLVDYLRDDNIPEYSLDGEFGIEENGKIYYKVTGENKIIYAASEEEKSED